MRLLHRYLLRQLVAPFCFALAALTGFMLISQVAKKFGALVGKGLPWSAITEVFVLSLPFIVAMTLPMAVLLAVLYTFSHLAADNEITAMRANGISVYQVLAPVLVWGVFMAGLNLAFVDQVLPRSNARLRSLLIDIGRKKAAFGLREQVINEVPPSKYFIRATRIDAATGRLKGVTIYDVGGDASRRIIYADSGSMAYAEGQTDLSLRLYDGSIHQFRPAEPTRFQLTYFTVNDIRVKNVYDELQRNTSESIRGDREMSTCEMMQVVDEAKREQVAARRERGELVQHDLRALLALPALPPLPVSRRDSAGGGYCAWLKSIQKLIQPGTAQAQTPAQPQSPTQHKVRPPTQGRVQSPTQGRARSPRAPVRTPPPQTPGHVQPPSPAPGQVQLPKLQTPPRSKVPLSTWSEVASAADRVREADRRADRYAVEIHKKWAISMACITFVIIGIVLALRFPRGGIGLVLGGGTLIFAIHYIGLTAGESLADRGHVAPWFAMWAPNIILTVLGVFGLLSVSRQSGSTRGGDFREMFDAVAHTVRRIRGMVFR